MLIVGAFAGRHRADVDDLEARQQNRADAAFPNVSHQLDFAAIAGLKIVDIGAMTAGKGTEPYAALVNAVPCEIIGFEPVATELEGSMLNDADRRFLPHVVGDDRRGTFHECNSP